MKKSASDSFMTYGTIEMSFDWLIVYCWLTMNLRIVFNFFVYSESSESFL